MRAAAESTPCLVTLTAHQFYLITEPHWNLGTPQSYRFSGVWNIFACVASKVIYHLHMKTCHSDSWVAQTHLQTDTPELLATGGLFSKSTWRLQTSGSVLAVASASVWLSHPLVLVTVVIEDNSNQRWHFHKSSGHARGSQVLLWWAPASSGAWAVVLSIPPCHPHLARWGQEPLGSLTQCLPGFRDDSRTAVCFLCLQNPPSLRVPTWAHVMVCMLLLGTEEHFPRSGEGNTLWFLWWWFISIHGQKLLT